MNKTQPISKENYSHTKDLQERIQITITFI